VTIQEWLEEMDASFIDIRHIIEEYHPTLTEDKRNMKITAHGAEAACASIRREIRNNAKTNQNVLDEFQDARINNDISTMIRIMNEAWFGIPESTSCWNIKGFDRLCDLMERPE
jgi:hypothetical protein